MSPAVRRRALAVLLPALFLAGCPKKRDRGGDDDVVDQPVQDVDAALNLTSIDPSTVASGTPFDATLFGAGFAPGITVYLGAERATSVTFASERTLEIRGPAMAPGRYDVEVVLSTGERSRLVQGLRVDDSAADCREVTVYFDLDRDALRTDSVAVLQDNLACLRGATAPITIEGHADERGTTEYNIALGQRRADSVREWLVRQGVGGTRVNTVSYGEERPVDPGRDEGAWARNRRAVVRLGR